MFRESPSPRPRFVKRSRQNCGPDFDAEYWPALAADEQSWLTRL
jgi:hypothetical protein